MNARMLWQLLVRSWREFGDDNCSQMAAAISYHVLFAIVPLTMFIVSMLGIVAGTKAAQERIVDEVNDYLRVSGGDVVIELTSAGREQVTTRYGSEAAAQLQQELAVLTPEQEQELAAQIEAGNTVSIAGYQIAAGGLTAKSDNLLAETLRGVVDASGPISFVSFIVLAYSASGLFGILRRSLDFVWGARGKRPLVQGKLLDLVMLLSVVLGLTALALLSIALTAFLSTLGFGGVLWSLVRFAVPWLITFVVCALLFRYGPHAHNHMRDIWPGAVLAATGLELLKYGYAIYIANFSNFDVVYGTLGGVMLFMLFVYLAAYVLLFSAELASEYPRLLGESPTPAAPPGESRSFRQNVLDAIRGLFVARR